MKISSNEEYGLRILLTIAKLSEEKQSLVTLNEIANKEGITTDYSMIFITLLKKASLIESIRGKNGGYKLLKTPEEITLLEVSKALSEEIFGPEYCDAHTGGKQEHCIHNSSCSIRSVWSSITGLVNNVLGKVSLRELMQAEGDLEKELQERIKSGELLNNVS